MPEPPDFDQIARRLIATTTGVIEREVVEQLRQVWNARGAADLEALDATIPFTKDGLITRAIRSLDR